MSRKYCGTSATRRRGYVLVMTIALIALAGLMLVGIARHSLTAAFQAILAEEELQRRWGALSCQRVLFERAAELFEFEVDARSVIGGERRFDAAQLAGTWVLGGMSFHWRLADEDAKVNVNTVFTLRGIQGATEIVRDFSRSDARWAPEVFLRPHRTERIAEEAPEFESWGQVFDLSRTRRSVSAPREIAVATANITCWGRGLLNIRRASDAALERFCGMVIGNDSVRHLQSLRRQEPPAEMEKMLNELGLREPERNQLREVLTDKSDYFSLWIEVVTSTRSWHEFHVATSHATPDGGSDELDGSPSASEIASAGESSGAGEITSTSASFYW